MCIINNGNNNKQTTTKTRLKARIVKLVSDPFVVIMNNKISLNQKKKIKKNLPMPSFLIKSKHDQTQATQKCVLS
jgi:hypothetical protein